MSKALSGSPRRNAWGRGCLGLVLTSWALLGYFALADAVLSEETASDNDFDVVYALLATVTLAAPISGLVALSAAGDRGERWLAWSAFALSLVLPCVFAIAIIAILSLGGDGLFGPPD